MSTDQLRRILAALTALKANAPEIVPKRYVSQYHDELDRLAALDFDVEEYRIPPDWIKDRTISAMVGAFSRQSSGQPMKLPGSIKQYEFFSKIDALLGLFTLATEGKHIGFRAPRKP